MCELEFKPQCLGFENAKLFIFNLRNVVNIGYTKYFGKLPG